MKFIKPISEGLKEIFRYQSNYQSIQVFEDEMKLGRILCLDGIVQLTTYDEYRYHECLAVVPYLYTRYAKRVAILGGGDGYAAKVLLDHFPVEEVTIVEIDPDIIEVSKAFFDFPDDDRVQVINEDAWDWAESYAGELDMVIMDYTDPTFGPAARLYTNKHFFNINTLLADDGVLATQMIAPFANPKASACLVKTLGESFPDKYVSPYKVHMPMYPPPSQQGFCVVSRYPVQLQVPVGLKFLNPLNMQSIFWLDNDEHYPLDMVEVSTLNNLMYKNLADRFHKKDIEEWEIEDQKSGDGQDVQEVRK